MSNKTKLVTLVIVVAIIIIGSTFTQTKKQSTSLTLGLMLPLTGDYAAAGQNMQKGMELALDQYKKNNPDLDIKVVVEDDGYNTKKGVTAYKKLVDYDKVDAILMLSTPVIDAIHEDVVKRGIPVIQLGVQTVGIADDNIIQFSPSSEAPIGYLATYLDKNDFIGKKVAVVYDNSPAQISFFETFKKNYKQDFTPFIVSSKNDLRGYAAKIANEKYEAVVVIQSPENGALLTKEIKTVATTMPILSYDAQLQTGFADYKRILGDTNKINGAKSMWFKSGKTDEFKKMYKEKYNNKEPGFLADFAFDMINTTLNSYNKDNTKWIESIEKTDNPEGVSGAISFDSNGVRIQPMVITQVENGELKPIQ